MEINGINPLGGPGQTDHKIETNEKSKTEINAPEANKADKVDVAGGDVAKFASQVAEIPEERTDRIEALQKAIADGNYEVSSEQVANSIIKEII